MADSNNCFLFGDCPELDKSCSNCISGEKDCEEDDGGERNVISNIFQQLVATNKIYLRNYSEKLVLVVHPFYRSFIF